MASCQQAGFLMLTNRHTLLLSIEKLRHDARDAAGRVLAHQFGEGGFRVVAPKQGGHFDRLRRLIELGAGRGDLQPTHRVPANDRQQRRRACADMRTELLLQNPKQVALWQVHLENRRKRVVPSVGLGANRHRQRHEIVFGTASVIGQHALEIADRLENSHISAEHMHGELHAAPRSLRSSSSNPELPSG